MDEMLIDVASYSGWQMYARRTVDVEIFDKRDRATTLRFESAEQAEMIGKLIASAGRAAKEHERLYAALRAAGHNVGLWAEDPWGLSHYARAINFAVPEVQA